MSRRVVAKFGGTSVKTEAAILRIVKILEKNPDIKFVVVSALGGITNLLIELCNVKDESCRNSIIKDIFNMHLELANALGLSIGERLSHEIQRLHKMCAGGDLNPEMIDNIVSLGEDLSSIIIHAYFVSKGMDAAYIDARDYLITDNNFGKAIPDLDRIKQYKFPSGLCITQGFIGSTLEKQTTTLGRGGSDYTAALIAEGINADELLIYTDVPGVYTMDPNIIREAKLIPEVSFHEMAEMANFGAKIVHPATLEPCMRGKVPIRVLSSFEFEKPGTVINVTEENKKNSPNIKAITMRPSQVLVTIKSLKMLNAHGFIARIFDVLANHKISVDLITTSEVSVALTTDTISSGSHGVNPFIKNQSLLRDLEKFATVIIEENLTLVAVIGSGLTIPGVIQKTLSAIEPYMVRLVCYGASNSNIGILVPKDNALNIVKILHRHLLENAQYGMVIASNNSY
jgi:aspartate kinase